jgi:hypothetical protein
MPILDLGVSNDFDLCAQPINGLASFIASLRVFAHQFWPADARSRERFLAQITVKALGVTEQLAVPDKGNLEVWLNNVERVQRWLLDDNLLPLGGFAVVSEGPSLQEIFANAKRPARLQNAVGWILLLARDIADHFAPERTASVNRSIDLAERFTKHNRKDLWAAWQGYKSVAHLCAANVFLNLRPELIPPSLRTNEGGLRLDTGLGLILAVARDFQRFGIAYVPARTKTPLLDQNEIWLIADDLRLPSYFLWQPHELPSEMKAAIAEYRAPTRKS